VFRAVRGGRVQNCGDGLEGRT